MNKINFKAWLLITVIFAIAITTLALSYIVTAPWHEMPELGADGGKNIFTFLYEVLYGKGLWFNGMNYPYGEHIVYTDAQPLLSVPLSYLKNRVTLETALTIMWWSIVLSYILAIVYCFKILIQFKVKPPLALCFAGLIILFSPQLFRISGHYALSYTCFLPMLFYWTIQYYSTNRWKYPVFIFMMGCITTFLHPYFAAVSLVWVGCYSAGYLIYKRDSILKRFFHVLPLLLSVCIVFLIFGIFMKITDPVTDRPATPFGILNNCSHIKEVISSVYSPFWNYIYKKHIFTHISLGGEGYTYVGLTVIIAVCLSFVKGFLNTMKLIGVPHLKRYATLDAQCESIISEQGFQPIWLFIAFVALLFSMGVPFIWHLEWLLNYASPLKQFRTLGRFSWIFYYIITIYGSVVICNWYERYIRKGKQVIACLVLFSAIGLWTFEVSGYIIHSRKAVAVGRSNYDLFVSKNDVSWEQFLGEHHYQKQDFQATLVLPFF